MSSDRKIQSPKGSKASSASPDLSGKTSSLPLPTKVGDEDKSQDLQMSLAVFEINKILKGFSSTKAHNILSMVGALKNLRVVSMDRPLGAPQPLGQKVLNTSVQKPSKGSPVKQANPLKKSDEYIRLSSEHKETINSLRVLNPAGKNSSSSSNQSKVETLIERKKELELKLKELRSSPSGNQ